MAGTATATYTTDVWTSPSVDGGQWEYAVPIRQDSTKHRSKSRSSHDSHARSRERNSKGSRSSSLSRHAYAHEHLTSRGRPQPSHSRRGSEAGSSRSIYGHDVASRSAGNVKDSTDSLYRKGSVRHGEWHEGMGMYTDEIDQDNWIHRDKLAKIESEELQQAAILLQRRAGEGNKTRAKNYDSYGTPASSPPTEQLEPWPSLHGDSQLREHSGSPTFPEEGEERGRWDSRRQEEGIANGAAGFYRNPGLRKSSSRIPIPSGIPVPVSPNPENGGREFSKQRSRANTHGDDDALSFGMPRRASEPMSVDSAQNITPAGSRPGSRGNTLQNAAGRKTTKGGATNRKTSAPPSTTRKATPRSRAPSSTLRATKAAENRPINRPEGDPPWLATMYKPDPRLPPDQQILPTHARRMQQEQWEKEGKTPTTYDREFAPLAIGPDGPQPSEKPAPKEEEPEPEPIEQNEKVEKEEVQEQKTPNLETPSKESGRPNSGTGYSTMPRVHEPPQAALQPKWSPPVVTAQEPPPKEKGCGCCIVM